MIYIVLIGIIGIIFFVSLQTNDDKRKKNGVKSSEDNTLNPDIYKILNFKSDKAFIQLAGIRHARIGNKLNFNIGEQVYLIPEPENRFDKNAIKVITSSGIKIGYIPKSANIEILDLMRDGFYFIVKISIINLEEPDYPFAMLDITKTKDTSIFNLTNLELEDINKKSINRIDKYKKDSRLSFELSQKGLELEKDDNIYEAIKCFEKAICLPNVPPISFKRLYIYYRKIKDYNNEIRVLKLNIEYIQNSKIKDYLKKDEITNIKNRIKKASLLQNKT